MEDGIKPRPTQTKVKHNILEKYLKTWGGIILSGLRRGQQAKKRSKSFQVHFVYVDCNAGTGRFDGEIEDLRLGKPRTLVFGSPIIGIRVLDNLVSMASRYGIELLTNSILMEIGNKEFKELRRSLDLAGFTTRVKETEDFSKLSDGEIALVNGDSTTLATQLIKYTQTGAKFSFYFLDPYGPKGIPLSFVREIIRQKRHDVMINMPYQDLHKKSGFVTKPYLTSEEKELVKNYDEMFGDHRWREIVRELEEAALFEEIGWYSEDDSAGEKTGTRFFPTETLQNASRQEKAKELELKLIDSYRDSLRSVDPEIAVKSIGLHFPDKERTMYYLYLTTHDPTGALAMNDVLWKAGYQEHELRWRYKVSKKQVPGQISMFGDPFSTPPAPSEKRAPTEEVAEHIFKLLRGQTLSKKGIYTVLADEPYFPGEIDKALRHLRKTKRASFEGSLSGRTKVAFGH